MAVITPRMLEYWDLCKEVCDDNGIPPYKLIHRDPEGSSQTVNVPNTAKSNRIKRGPGPVYSASSPTVPPPPPGPIFSVWLIFRGQELRSGDATSGDTFAFGEQMGRAMAQISLLTADTKQMFIIADNDLVEQPLTGYLYRVENPVLDPSQAYFTAWMLQEV